MDNLDKVITEVVTRDIELTEEYKDNIENAIYQCTHNIKKYNILSKIKKIIIASLIGVSSLTVYAATSKNFNFKNMGLLKLNQNYEESAVEINKTIENEYFTLTLESMAGDNAYVVAEYKIELKEKALQEFGEVPFDKERGGYQLNFANRIFVNSQKSNYTITNIDKIGENEYYYSQVINVMNVDNSDIKLEIYFNNLYIGYYGKENKIEIDKKLQIDVKANKTDKTLANEQKVDENKKIIIEGMFNTKFETYIKAQEITENITYGEYSGYHGVGTTYDSFVVADENGNTIPYQTYYGEWAGKSIYVENENGEMKKTEAANLKDSDKIKVVENFIIIIGKNEDLKKVKVVPIRTGIYNDRNDEEQKAYNKAKWYPIVEGETKYTAKSGLGGTFTINKITIDDENINFYYDQQGLIGNEFKILIRNNNGTMNYIHSSKEERKELNSDENKITFARYGGMNAGANIVKGELDNIKDISKYEFTLLFGSQNKIIGKEVELTIPEEDKNIDTFENIQISNINKIKLKYWLENEEYPMYMEIKYDENNQVFDISGDYSGYIEHVINIEDNRELDLYIDKIQKYFEEKDGGSEILE